MAIDKNRARVIMTIQLDNNYSLSIYHVLGYDSIGGDSHEIRSTMSIPADPHNDKAAEEWELKDKELDLLLRAHMARTSSPS